MTQKEFIYYLKDYFHPDGEWLPESKCRISVRDRGNRVNVYSSMRTIKKTKIFQLDHQMKRIANSLRMLELDPGISVEEIGHLATECAERNAPLLEDDEEQEITTAVTPGVHLARAMWTEGQPSPPTIYVTTIAISLKTYGKFYRDGIHVVLASNRIPPPQVSDPKIKSHYRMHQILAQLQTKKVDSGPHWTLMLDIYGNIGETQAAHIFIVKNGSIITPTSKNVLYGISRSVVLELAEKLGIPAFERDIQVYDLFAADEAFVTATSYGMFPIARFNTKILWEKVPGPITKRLMDAYNEKLEGSIEYALSLLR